MKIGDKIPIVLEVVKPAVHGEQVAFKDGEVELNNHRGNKWWAAPVGSNVGPLVLVCDDGDTEAGLMRRRAIVDLIECGPGPSREEASFQSGWKQGMLDAQDMLRKGVSVDRAVEGFPKA